MMLLLSCAVTQINIPKNAEIIMDNLFSFLLSGVPSSHRCHSPPFFFFTSSQSESSGRRMKRVVTVIHTSRGRLGVAQNGVLTSRRHQTIIPNKGVRTQPPVPDRLKDSMAMMGVDPRAVNQEEHFVPQEKRTGLFSEVMSNTQYLRSHGKLDRLRIALDAVKHSEANDPKWDEVYLFLRTTEMCTEIVKNETDVLPKGQKLYIELQACEERRVPPLCRLPNGLLVLPIFSMEEYLDHYFSRVEKYESSWFPFPRNGTQWENFCSLEFPVCCTGELQHYGAFATVAYPYQFGILLNPGQSASKFITYTEMVELAKVKRERASRKRNVKLRDKDTQGNSRLLFDETLLTTFNTEKTKFEWIPPERVEECMRDRPPIPPISQMELHLLLFPYPEISSVYIHTVDQPRWRQMMGSTEKTTRIEVVCEGKEKPDKAFFDHLQRWSFMKEFSTDVHVELTNKIPTQVEGNQYMCVYTAADGDMLRRAENYKGTTLAEALGYNDPLTDADGKHYFGTTESYF
ncbi:hypothetical protein AGDE_02367 [Angomonas deanei]|uniref:Uncharacterized protein n=1 Tax=Angomonas deanei TaxID=59799 RepID=S9VFI9_9TRYP|nr:hypothetical protein AGDE_08987 [Angomonas deanei]EPY41557.1 hypothetical protein AGDE_02367 [Angomonas deanei]CAD2216618.1 hypothetical protein, conserved [Angomonas deanei]|eukprot:EPY31567.1 hypothetical protein AGDE_08987 [Angomonas deanei]